LCAPGALLFDIVNLFGEPPFVSGGGAPVRASKSAVLGHYAGHRTPGAALKASLSTNRGPMSQPMGYIDIALQKVAINEVDLPVRDLDDTTHGLLMPQENIPRPWSSKKPSGRSLSVTPQGASSCLVLTNKLHTTTSGMLHHSNWSPKRM
jgi:hypothetical protein